MLYTSGTSKWVLRVRNNFQIVYRAQVDEILSAFCIHTLNFVFNFVIWKSQQSNCGRFEARSAAPDNGRDRRGREQRADSEPNLMAQPTAPRCLFQMARNSTPFMFIKLFVWPFLIELHTRNVSTFHEKVSVLLTKFNLYIYLKIWRTGVRRFTHNSKSLPIFALWGGGPGPT